VAFKARLKELNSFLLYLSFGLLQLNQNVNILLSLAFSAQSITCERAHNLSSVDLFLTELGASEHGRAVGEAGVDAPKDIHRQPRRENC
jgi:hypothetical protein